MTPEIIGKRLDYLLASAEETLLLGFRDITARAAHAGALGGSRTMLMRAACLGDALDDFVATALLDLPAIERGGANPEQFYEELRGKVTQLKLRGMAAVEISPAFGGPSATAIVGGEVAKRLARALDKIAQYQAGFDRPTSPTASNAISITGSQGVVVQQGSPAANLTATVEVRAVQEVLRSLEAEMPWAGLDDEVAEEFRAEIETMKAQLRKRSPSAIVLREAAKTIRSLAENIGASAIGPSVLALVQPLLVAVGLN